MNMRKQICRDPAKRAFNALCAAGYALELAIDAREMTMHQFQRKYEKQMPPGWITPTLRKALGKVKRAIK